MGLEYKITPWPFVHFHLPLETIALEVKETLVPTDVPLNTIKLHGIERLNSNSFDIMLLRLLRKLKHYDSGI